MAIPTTHSPSMWQHIENGLYYIQDRYNAAEAKVENLLLRKLTPAQTRLALDCIKAVGIALIALALPAPACIGMLGVGVILAVGWKDWFCSDRKIVHILQGQALANIVRAGIVAAMGAAGALPAGACIFLVITCVAIAAICLHLADTAQRKLHARAATPATTYHV